MRTATHWTRFNCCGTGACSIGRQRYNMDLLIERLHDLPVDGLDGLLAESEQAGIRFVRRLVEEWSSGANRFDRPGEALFGARVGGQWVGVCGVNVDPYAAEERVGRVRHLYVL